MKDLNKVSADVDYALQDLDLAISALDIHKDQAAISDWIRQYDHFILSIVSQIKKEYIHIENDESYSVALMAFVEAIDRYDIAKGPFLPFCRLVITSRVKNQLKLENRHQHLSLDAHVIDLPTAQSHPKTDKASSLEEEIREFEAALLTYGIPFSALADNAPKHQDTRKLVIDTAFRIFKEPDFMAFLHNKKRLPISQIAARFFVSVKTLKSYKSFLIAVLMILENDLVQIKEWLGFKK